MLFGAITMDKQWFEHALSAKWKKMPVKISSVLFLRQTMKRQQKISLITLRWKSNIESAQLFLFFFSLAVSHSNDDRSLMRKIKFFFRCALFSVLKMWFNLICDDGKWFIAYSLVRPMRTMHSIHIRSIATKTVKIVVLALNVKEKWFENEIQHFDSCILFASNRLSKQQKLRSNTKR